MLKVGGSKISFMVCMDSIKESVSGVLTKEEKVIAYESQILEYKQRYFSYDLELIGVVHSLKM